jgi:hypothetical protein
MSEPMTKLVNWIDCELEECPESPLRRYLSGIRAGFVKHAQPHEPFPPAAPDGEISELEQASRLLELYKYLDRLELTVYDKPTRVALRILSKGALYLALSVAVGKAGRGRRSPARTCRET